MREKALKERDGVHILCSSGRGTDTGHGGIPAVFSALERRESDRASRHWDWIGCDVGVGVEARARKRRKERRFYFSRFLYFVEEKF